MLIMVHGCIDIACAFGRWARWDWDL